MYLPQMPFQIIFPPNPLAGILTSVSWTEVPFWWENPWVVRQDMTVHVSVFREA